MLDMGILAESGKPINSTRGGECDRLSNKSELAALTN